MRVTKSYIKQLVKEELTKVLNESAPTEDVQRIMDYLKDVYVMPKDAAEFESAPERFGGQGKSFEEFAKEVEAATGAPYAKVYSVFLSHDGSDREGLGQHKAKSSGHSANDKALAAQSRRIRKGSMPKI
jgi:hypothetical protein